MARWMPASRALVSEARLYELLTAWCVAMQPGEEYLRLAERALPRCRSIFSRHGMMLLALRSHVCPTAVRQIPMNPVKDAEIDMLEKDVKESYGAIPDIPSLSPEMFAEVTLAVAPHHLITGICFVRGCAPTVDFAPSV